ncbi:hypothetical protein AQ505_11760 [Pedobacter sp. PACM 27299]|nr:hypothetical protein AQ505_11760 [Pedobacter sp. PACM 27299]
MEKVLEVYVHFKGIYFYIPANYNFQVIALATIRAFSNKKIIQATQMISEEINIFVNYRSDSIGIGRTNPSLYKLSIKNFASNFLLI